MKGVKGVFIVITHIIKITVLVDKWKLFGVNETVANKDPAYRGSKTGDLKRQAI